MIHYFYRVRFTMYCPSHDKEWDELRRGRERETERQTDRDRDGQTNRQKERQTDESLPTSRSKGDVSRCKLCYNYISRS